MFPEYVLRLAPTAAIRSRCHREPWGCRLRESDGEVLAGAVECDSEVIEKVGQPPKCFLTRSVEHDDRWPADESIFDADLEIDRSIPRCASLSWRV